MKSTLEIAKEFVEKLKQEETTGQDSYPFWYIYRTEFMALEYILKRYEELVKEKTNIS